MMNPRLALIAGTAAALAACADGEDPQDATEATAMSQSAERVENMQTADPAAVDPAEGQDGEALVTVIVSGVEPGAGDVFVALQDRVNFATVAGELTGRSPANGETVTIPLENVPDGAYAVSAFQDTNGDQTVTLRSNGPSEPYGFSGPEQGGWPEYELADFEVSSEGRNVEVSLIPPTNKSSGVRESNPNADADDY